jgi:hypothetical protein
MAAAGRPNAIYRFDFAADSGDAWGGWFVAAADAFAAGAELRIPAGAYTVLGQTTDVFEVDLFGLQEGQVFVEWYRDGQSGQFLPTRNGPATPAGTAGLGSELDAAWDGAAWTSFGEGGLQQSGPSARLVGRAFRSDNEAWTSQELLPRSLSDLDGDGQADVVGFGTIGVWVARAGSAGFGPAYIAMSAFGAEAGGWTSQDRFPRMLADVNGDGRSDVVGFGSAGVQVALSSTAGGFEAPRLVLSDFTLGAGGWTSQDRFPRMLADVNGDGRSDLVGFGYAGVQVALANASGGFETPRLALNEFSLGAGGWISQDRFPRMLADVNGDGRADVVGFGYAGVSVAFANDSGGFEAPRLVLSDFGVGAGGWTSQDRFPRMMADVNGDGRADVVGFGYAGVQVALANASDGFDAPRLVLAEFSLGAGGWTGQEQFPRMMADVNGDGRSDLVGFGFRGVSVALADAAGGFEAPSFAVPEFGWVKAGWTSQDLFPRMMADVNGDGRSDLVGFGRQGVATSWANANGGFDPPRLMLPDFGAEAGGWTSQDRFPRMLADVNGDGRADLVAFGYAGMQVALANADGGFEAPHLMLRDFAVGAGGWTSQDRFPRMMADVNGDGQADLVGFGYAGVQVALAHAEGGFEAPRLVLRDFAVGAGGWTSQDRFPRMMADVNGDGRADVVGFGYAGVQVALANASGGFEAPRLVLRDFAVGAGGWTGQEQFPRMMADVNGDGRSDLVGFGFRGVSVALANEAGGFEAPQLLSGEFGVDTGWTSQDQFPRMLADVNGDGRADVVGFRPEGVWVDTHLWLG